MAGREDRDTNTNIVGPLLCARCAYTLINLIHTILQKKAGTEKMNNSIQMQQLAKGSQTYFNTPKSTLFILACYTPGG